MGATVRVSARGRAGQLFLEGQFDVINKEFSAESLVCLTLSGGGTRVLLEIPFEILQEIEGAPSSESMRAAAELAENRVVSRLTL